MQIEKIEKIILDIKKYISKCTIDNSFFNHLAIRLYNIHYEMNDVYRRYCNDDQILTWSNIPLMPTSVYSSNSPIGLSMQTEMPFPGIVFKNNSASHYIRDTELYKFSIVNSYPKFILDEDNLVPWINFIGMTNDDSYSSSKYVIEYLSEVFHGSIIFDPNKIFDKIQETYGDEVTISIPAVITAHQHSYQNLLNFSSELKKQDEFYAKLNLGSKAIEIQEGKTNSSMSVSMDIMNLFDINQVTRMLITPEITSPMYSTIKKSKLQACIKNNIQIEPEYFAGPWMKFRLIDDKTGRHSLPGKYGRVAFYDLSNLWSCPFVLTNYIGKIGPKGGLVFENAMLKESH